MRIRIIFLFLFLAFLGLPTLADQGRLAQLLRSDGYPLEASALERLVEVEASAEWWAILLNPSGSSDRAGLRIVVSNIFDLAEHMGLADVDRLDSDTGGKGNSPPVLATLDGWKGTIKIKLVLNFVPDDTSKKETLAGLDRLGYPIGTVAEPRSGKFFFTASFDPKVTEMKGTVSADGSSYDFVLPAYMGWSQSKVDDIVRTGN